MDETALVQSAIDFIWKHAKSKFRSKLGQWDGKVTPSMRYFAKQVLPPLEEDEQGQLVLPDKAYVAWEEYCCGDIDDLSEPDFLSLLSLCRAINEKLQ